MKMEEHFKETLNRAVANEPPVLDAWDRFEQRAVRGRRVRLFAAIAAATAIAVASVIVVPKLGTGPANIAPANDPYEGWQRLENADQLWAVRFPPGWRTYVDEGYQTFQPPGVEPAAKGDPTFFISIQPLLNERTCPPPEEIQTANPGWQCGTNPNGESREDGRMFYRLENTEGDAHVLTYGIDWRTPSCVRDPICTEPVKTLIVNIRADNDSFWSAYSVEGLKIVRSIEFRGVITDPYAGWQMYTDDKDFRVRYPQDWTVRLYEDNPEIVAPGQRPGAGSGDATMSVYFALLTEEFDSPEIRQQGFDRSTRPDGRPYVWTERMADGRTYVDYRFDWSKCVPHSVPTSMPSSCTRTARTLVVTIQIGTPALGEQHRETAERIVTSLEYTGAA